MRNPVLDDVGSPECAEMFRTDRERYIRIAREWTKRYATGETVGQWDPPPLFKLCDVPRFAGRRTTQVTLEALVAVLDSSSPDDVYCVSDMGTTPLHGLVSAVPCQPECVEAFLERFPDAAFFGGFDGKEFSDCPFVRSCKSSSSVIARVFLHRFEAFLSDWEDENGREKRKCVLSTFGNFLGEGPKDIIELYFRVFGEVQIHGVMGNPFEKLFASRATEHQLRLFPFYVRRFFAGDRSRVKPLLTASVLAPFFTHARDDHKPDRLFNKIFKILGDDLFELSCVDGSNVLHWLSRNTNFSRNRKLFGKVMGRLPDDIFRRLLAVQEPHSIVGRMLSLSLVARWTGDELRNLRSIVKRSPECLRERDLDGRNPLQAFCFDVRKTSTFDSSKVFETFRMLVEEGPRGIASTLSAESEVLLREAGHDSVVSYLLENDADFAPSVAFFDLVKPQDVVISCGGTVAQPKVDYGLAISHEAWSTGKHVCYVKVDTLTRPDGIFLGVARKDVPKIIYLGNRPGGVAIRSNGTKHQEGEEEMAFCDPFFEGSKIEMILDCDASTLTFVVNGEKLHSATTVRNLPPGELVFGFGMLYTSTVRVLVEWSPHTHLNYRKSFRDLILLMLMIAARPESVLFPIPREVFLYGIFGYINCAWWD